MNTFNQADVVESFTEWLNTELDLEPCNGVPTSGERFYCRAKSKAKRNKDGRAGLFLDGRPAGWGQNHYTGSGVRTWAYGQDEDFTPAQREVCRAAIEAARREREAEDAKVKAAAAELSARILKEDTAGCPVHPYNTRKGVQVHGLRVTTHELRLPCADGETFLTIPVGSLVVPLADVHDKLWSLQFITPDGAKWFLPGGRKRGLFFLLGKLTGQPGEVVLEAEGFATAATIHEDTGRPVLVAFDAGNMTPVVEEFQAAHPGVRLGICCDDDHHKTPNTGIEAGKKALAAAQNGTLIVPALGPAKQTGATDFNDWAQALGPGGLDVIKMHIENTLAQTTATTETAAEGPKITLRLASDMVHDLFSKPLPPPIVTPFPQLNDLQGGGLRGVNILAAVTGRFKTGLALTQARYTARTRPVIYLSTEVDPRQALARVAAQELGRAWRPLYEDPTAEATVAGAIEGLRLYVMTIASVAQLLDVFSSIPFYEKDSPLVVLDYLQGLSRAAEDRRLAVGCVSEAITAWTRTTGGVVLAVSSISRANYFGTDEKSATDFVNAAKESGDVEYDAASVMFLDVPAPPLGGTSEGRLHVAKARFGSPGTIGLFVDGPSGTFQADPAGGLTADQRVVLEAVQAGARSGNAIAKDAGLRRSKVDPCLRALRARNLIDANNNLLDAASHLPRQNGQNAATLPGNTSEVFPGAETVGASPSEKVFPGIGKQAVSSRTVSAPYGGGTGNTGNLLSLPFRGNGKPGPGEGEVS